MDLIADILLLSAALGAGFYCLVLSRRLARFTDLEKGVGGAVAVLSVQVDELKDALEKAKEAAIASSEELGNRTERAEQVAERLETLLATTHLSHEQGSSNKSQKPRSIRRRRRGQPQLDDQGEAA